MNPAFRILLLALSLVGLCSPAAAADDDYRSWTSAAGTTIEARLIGDPAARSITLEQRDGSTFQLRPNQLSADDRRYLQELGAPRRILFVGNSYTRGISGMVKGLIAASPHSDCALAFVAPGGKTLQFHLQNEATMDKIREGDWDIVVLQDQSQTPAVARERFMEAAQGIDEIIDATEAQTVFYETWGRRDGDKMNRHLFPDYGSMQEALSESYGKAADRCDATLAPVGRAWARLREREPELGRELYTGDGSHPARPGSFLAACVFYATFFDADPSEVDFDGGLPADQVAAIHAAVAEVIDS